MVVLGRDNHIGVSVDGMPGLKNSGVLVDVQQLTLRLRKP